MFEKVSNQENNKSLWRKDCFDVPFTVLQQDCSMRMKKTSN